jgi:hypothetical protein
MTTSTATTGATKLPDPQCGTQNADSGGQRSRSVSRLSSYERPTTAATVSSSAAAATAHKSRRVPREA